MYVYDSCSIYLYDYSLAGVVSMGAVTVGVISGVADGLAVPEMISTGIGVASGVTSTDAEARVGVVSGIVDIVEVVGAGNGVGIGVGIGVAILSEAFSYPFRRAITSQSNVPVLAPFCSFTTNPY
jgi:hypothetical protein